MSSIGRVVTGEDEEDVTVDNYGSSYFDYGTSSTLVHTEALEEEVEIEEDVIYEYEEEDEVVYVDEDEEALHGEDNVEPSTADAPKPLTSTLTPDLATAAQTIESESVSLSSFTESPDLASPSTAGAQQTTTASCEDDGEDTRTRTRSRATSSISAAAVLPRIITKLQTALQRTETGVVTAASFGAKDSVRKSVQCVAAAATARESLATAVTKLRSGIDATQAFSTASILPPQTREQAWMRYVRPRARVASVEATVEAE